MTELGQRVVESIRAALKCEPEWTADVEGGFVWWPSPLRQWVVEFLPDESYGPEAVGVSVGMDMVRDIDDSQAGLAWVWTLNDTGPVSPYLWDADQGAIGTEFHLIVTPENEAAMTRLACDAAVLQITNSGGPAFEIAEELGTEPNMTFGPNSEPRIDISDSASIATSAISLAGEGPTTFTAAHLAEFVEVASSFDLEAELEHERVQVVVTSIALEDDDPGDDYTATIEFRSDVIDEFLGAGLLCEIRDSMPVAPFTGAAGANMLNLAENAGDPAITTLGAWSATPADEHSVGDLLQFRVFLPNTVAAPGLVGELTKVFLRRVELARQVFQDLEASSPVDDLGEFESAELDRLDFARECFFAPGAHPNEPTSQALNEPDPRSAMLNAVLGVIQPDEWVVQTERGFWWLPYRLRHDFDIIETPLGDDEFFTTLRFRTALVEDVTDAAAALDLANRLNQASFGCSVWFDPDTAMLAAGSAVRLDPQRPWMPRTFLANYMHCVGILERLALDAATKVGGFAPCHSHPDLGDREGPDSLVQEHLLQTESPVSAVGWRFSRNEVDRFASSWARWLDEWGVADPVACVAPSGTCSGPEDELRLSAHVNWDGPDLVMNCGLVRHPELGWGYQIVDSLLDAPVIGDDVDTLGAPQDVWTANLLNRLESNYPILPLVMGGWSGAGGQIHKSSFLTASTAELLGAPTSEVARALAWITADLFNPGPVGDLLESALHIGTRPTSSPEWTSITDDRGQLNVLTLDKGAFDQVLAGEIVEDVQQSPRFKGDLWTLPVQRVLASYGRLTGGPPYVATLSTSVDPTTGTTVVVERRWSPEQTGAWVRGVIAPESPDGQVDAAAAAAIELLDAHELDWFMTEDPAFGEVAQRALRPVAERAGDGLLERARHLMDTVGDPLKRLEWTQPPKYLAPLVGDGIDNWLHVVQLRKNVDGHVAAVPALWAHVHWSTAGEDDKAAAALARRRRTPGL